MKGWSFWRLAPALSFAIAMAGCASGGGALPREGTSLAAMARSEAASQDLLYVSDTITNDVYVYSYPRAKLVHTLSGLTDPAGECVDRDGDVFVANTGRNNIIEYAHGATSLKATLDDPGYFPIGCSVDPTTGNLAVTNVSPSSSASGNVVVYLRAKGRPTGDYADAAMPDPLLCGYDDAGNLFVDGTGPSGAFAFAELRSGEKKLANVSLNQHIGNAGGVQWDGSHIAVGDQSTNTIYRFDVSGKQGKVAGSTQLGGATQVFQFWIAGAKVIGADAYAADVGIWKYPAGGAAVKIIDGLYAPLGVTVSLARHSLH
jgi:DNA-binding beta-propeller fold protein YncE